MLFNNMSISIENILANHNKKLYTYKKNRIGIPLSLTFILKIKQFTF